MNKTNQIALFLLSTWVFISGCKVKCKNAPDGEVLLDPHQTKSIAYHGNDSVRFIISGQEVLFTSGNPIQYFNSYQFDTECDDQQKLEGKRIILSDINYKYSIDHSQAVSSSDTSDSRITVILGQSNFSFPFKYLTTPYVFGTKTINGKVYNKVYVARYLKDSLYYNSENGIIRIVQADSIILQLK